MKALLLLILLNSFAVSSYAQITSPIIKANFGVDGDLRCNFYDNFIRSGNDDWFLFPNSTGTGQFVIDTTGAAAIVARYNTNTASRRLPFYRSMRYPGFTVVNNRLLLDAVMIRDYHGDDSTVFSGGNKNGTSPANWSCPVSQGVPDKNDILDMLVHVRRAGPARTDSLWMFGGLSLDNTTGNRYFDFEMYQTDIYYDRASQQFYGYGPDAGHTSWQFDAAGNITTPGDIIFSAEYQSSSLSMVAARIWVHRSALSLNIASFDWTNEFDGASAGADYGYAGIRPKTGGAYYTGLQCNNNTWAGPFSAVLQNESVVTTYQAGQFVEFSVNLTKLGLDPVTLLGSNSCGMPFRRILVKTRSSSSFTAELKDFVGPFDFFLAPRVQALTTTPYICAESGAAEINVTNSVATSIYQWTTLDGNIISSSTGPTIYVNTPGTYIVTQYLQDGCAAYAVDTIQIRPLGFCQVLAKNYVENFNGRHIENQLQLNWQVKDNQLVQFFEVEKSDDGIHFTSSGRVAANPESSLYTFVSSNFNNNRNEYYRIKLVNTNGSISYSKLLLLSSIEGGNKGVVLYPNPVKDRLHVQLTASKNSAVKTEIFNAAGNRVHSSSGYVKRGMNEMRFNDLKDLPAGVYIAVFYLGNEVIREKIIVTK